MCAVFYGRVLFTEKTPLPLKLNFSEQLLSHAETILCLQLVHHFNIKRKDSQRRSHLFLVGAAVTERRMRECERRRREAILGGGGVKFLNKRCDFVHS